MCTNEHCKNVCRCFVFHNDYIPPVNQAHDEWDYMAFGYYDGISVFENVAGLTENTLGSIWENSIQQKAKELGTGIKQVIYGFRTEIDQMICKDEEFWADKDNCTQYPFLFFVMLQLHEENKDSLKLLFAQKDALEQKYTKDGQYKAIAYLTLDNSDIFLILRCQEYKWGANLVEEMHSPNPFFDKWSVKYSFTIPAVNRKFLNDSAAVAACKGAVEHAYIYATEIMAGSVDRLQSNIEDEINDYFGGKLSVLGYNDELIHLQNMPWEKFLNLYRDYQGAFNYSSETFQKSVASITTIIATEQQRQRVSGVTNPCDTSEDEDNSVMVWFVDCLKEELQHIANCDVKCKDLRTNMLMSLYGIADSVAKFQRKFIRDNLFFPTAIPILLLVKMVGEILENCKDQPDNSEKKVYADYDKFLEGLSLYAQNFSRSDRQFTQAMDFDVKIYNMPVKLNTFYSAFIFWVKDFLMRDNESHKYEFITCMGVSVNMYVEELFVHLSESRRIFLVNIPENQVYDMDTMMIMLCHEVAHFVGRDIRNREMRTQKMVESLLQMIVWRYQIYIDEPKVGDEFWGILLKHLKGAVADKYKEFELDRNYGELIAIINAEIMNVPKIVADYVECEKIKEGLSSTDIARKKEEVHRLFYQESVALRDVTPDRINTWSIADMVMYLFKECLADIAAIFCLSLSPEQYYKSLHTTMKWEGNEDVYDEKFAYDAKNNEYNASVDKHLIRAAFVTKCMCRSNIWNIDILNKMREEGIEKGFVSRIISYIKHHLGRDADVNNWRELLKEFEKDGLEEKEHRGHLLLKFRMISSGEISSAIIEYLSECCDGMKKRGMDKKDKLIQLRNLFTISQEENVEKQMLAIQENIFSYRIAVEEMMKKLSIQERTEDGYANSAKNI